MESAFINSRINYREENKGQAIVRAATYTRPKIITLVEIAASGNFEAFAKLYHIYVEQIYRYVFYQVKDKMTAEDITADVFVKALDKIQSCKGKESTFSSWLYRIAYNVTIDNFRNARKNLPIDLEMVSNLDDPKQEIRRNLERQELFEAISKLPKNQRRFIILKFIEGMDNREVGQIMGKSQVALRLLQLRAIAALRKEITGG